MENFHIILIFILSIILFVWLLFLQKNSIKSNVGCYYDPYKECCGNSMYYWEEHPRRWPDNLYPNLNFFKSGKTWIRVLRKYPDHKIYYILAKQYIIILLNQSIGCDYPYHQNDINDANTFFETYTPETAKNIDMSQRHKYIKISQRLKCASDCLERFNGNI